MLRPRRNFALLFTLVLYAGMARTGRAEPEEILVSPGAGEADIRGTNKKSEPAEPDSEIAPTEEREPPATPGRKARKLAAVEREREPVTVEKSEAPTPPSNHASPTHMTIGLVGGITTLSSGGGLAFGGDSAKYNFAAALPADFRAKYWGIDLEGFYSSAGYTTGNADSTYQGYGGMLNLKGFYPITTGHVIWTPKAGVGYAYLGQTTNQTGAGSGTQAGATLNVNGAYAVLGIDIEIYSSFLISADYAFSFYGNANLTFSGAATSLTSAQPYTSYAATFQRLRASAYYRILPKFLVGFQFIQRSIGADSTASGYASSIPTLFTPQNQYGLAVLFQF